MVLYLLDVDQFSVEGARRACARVVNEEVLALAVHSGQSKKKAEIVSHFANYGVSSRLVSGSGDFWVETVVAAFGRSLESAGEGLNGIVVISNNKRLVSRVIVRCRDFDIACVIEGSGQYQSDVEYSPMAHQGLNT